MLMNALPGHPHLLNAPAALDFPRIFVVPTGASLLGRGIGRINALTCVIYKQIFMRKKTKKKKKKNQKQKKNK